MRKQWTNLVNIEGYVYSATLFENVTGENSKNPGTKYINGTVNIATDEDGVNIVPVRYTYVTPTWSSGKANETYGLLKRIVDEQCTWSEKGKDEALKLRIQGDASVNDFLGRDGNMVESREVRGGFTHEVRGEFGDKRNNFNIDMVIAGVIEPEVDDADNEYIQLRGYTFNFRNDLIPVLLNVTKASGGIDYFRNQDISNSNPMVVNIWGNIVNSTIKTEITKESAFGAPTVEYSTRTFRAWEVTGANPIGDWDDESTVTIAEFKELLNARQTTIAEAKKRGEEAQKRNQSGFPANGSEKQPANRSVTADKDFKF